MQNSRKDSPAAAVPPALSSLRGRSPNSRSFRLENDERGGELGSMTLDGAGDKASLAVRRLAGKTDEQNASTRLPPSIDELTEILVLRERYGARVRR